MVQKDIMQTMQEDLQKKKKLEELSQKRMQIAEEDKQALSEYEKSVRRTLDGKQTEVSAEAKTRIDQGIERKKLYKQEISDLTESITKDFQELGDTYLQMGQYKGIETVLMRLHLTRLADRQRSARANRVDVKQNLETILDVGKAAVKKLYEFTLENMEQQATIDGLVKDTAAKLKENQPEYEKWRAQTESYTRDIKALQDKMDKADETEFAKLSTQKAELDKKLQDAKIQQTYFFTIVDGAKKMLPTQKDHLQQYSEIVEGLVQLRTNLDHYIENSTKLYMALPTALKTMLGVKAASQWDKAAKYALEKGTETLHIAAKGIRDESLNRQEKYPISPEKFDEFRKDYMATVAEFTQRESELKRKHATPGLSTE